MKTDNTFDNLIENGFDFLKKALQEFEQEPKFSAIHFYTALELFLKARLLREHWTLILTKPEQGNLTKFRSGDFHSVGLDEAVKRLDDILQETLSPDEIKCFRDLKNHRNRMVHFFHAGTVQNQPEIEAIVSLQCRGWHYLYTLLTQQWSKIFSKYQKEIESSAKAMLQHRRFLQTRFTDLNSEITKRQTAGTAFHECPSCGFVALEEDTTHSPALSFACLVCHFSTNGIVLTCPNCSENVLLIQEPWQHCHKCNHEFTSDEVKKFLFDPHTVTKDNMFEAFEASCGECQSHLSVIRSENGKWVCSNCFAQFESSDIGSCEWCNEATTEDLSDSYWRGCEFCDGSAAWHADRD